jgi:hypothetical protein
MLRSLQGFSDDETNSLVAYWKALNRSGGSLFKDLLEDAYFRDLMDHVPKMVERTVKLSAIVTQKIPAEDTIVYLREATRTYIAGYWHASVALSRAALEEALREKVRETGLGIEAYELKALINAAHRTAILDDAHLQLTREVQTVGNNVLHGTTVDDQQAWDVLCAVRGVLRHLFRK